jgi:biopolymer transport protein ExbD
MAYAGAMPPVVLIRMSGEGSFQIEGQRYLDPNAFKTKISEIEHRKPQPEITIVTAPGETDFKTVGRAIWLCQQAGVSKIGFLTEPSSDDQHIAK